MKDVDVLKEELTETFEVINPDPKFVEVRILQSGKGTVSGYFNDPEILAKAVGKYDGRNNVFITLNEIDQNLAARAKNRFKEWAKETTTDQDIVRRKWILVDFDPKRPSGISSTDEELNAAGDHMKKVKKFLAGMDFPEPVVAMSGNGYHLLYPVNLPNDEKSLELVKSFLQVLDGRFSSETVAVDTTTCNAARITKLYGTIACKGDDTEERPHRRSKILSAPKGLKPVGEELIQKVVYELTKNQKDTSPKKQEKQVQSWKRPSVKTYLTEHGLEISREKPYMGGTCYVLKRCPFNPDHTDTGAYVIEFPNGKICAGCHHDSCAGKGWKELLKRYPDRRMMPPKREESRAKEESIVDTMLGDIEAEGHTFFHDRAEIPYVCVVKDGIRKYMEVYGNDYRKYIRYMCYQLHHKAVPKESLQQVLDTMAVKAQNEGVEITPAYRCAFHDQKIFYYLADPEQTVICIDKDGYRVIEESPVPFIKKQNMSEQVLPLESETSLKKFGRKYWNFTTQESRVLHWVLIITRFIAEGSRPIIYYMGDRGSAKSTSMKLDKMIVDPSEIDVKALPKSVPDVVATVSGQYAVCFDNVSRVSEEVSDIFCIAATDGYYSKRMLYTDNAECAVKLNARIALSGITNLTSKPDLVDRLVCLRLERIDSTKRLTEAEIKKDFRKDLPYILDRIFITLSKAISIYEKINLERLPRMADFAKWGYAVAEALGYGGDKFLKLYERNQVELLDNMLSEDTVLSVLITVLREHHYFKGTVTELLSSLTAVAEENGINTKAGWVRDASALSRRLYENQSVLNLYHIEMHRGKANGERYIEIWLEDESQETE